MLLGRIREVTPYVHLLLTRDVEAQGLIIRNIHSHHLVVTVAHRAPGSLISRNLRSVGIPPRHDVPDLGGCLKRSVHYVVACSGVPGVLVAEPRVSLLVELGRVGLRVPISIDGWLSLISWSHDFMLIILKSFFR